MGPDQAAPPDVVVAIPARDESATIRDCLASVVRAGRRAQHDGAACRVRIVVAAHRCRDDTTARARTTLVGLLGEGGDFDVLVVASGDAVGVPRRAAVAEGLVSLGCRLQTTWVFSTDADSVVPADWITLSLSEARTARALAVTGMTTLHAHTGSSAARAAYDSIVERGLYVAADGGLAHSHVYGANLAVRADAYQLVGGFPAEGHGEDQRLIDSLAAAHVPIARTRRLVVSTSGRAMGRATGGLAHLLRSLEDEEGLRAGDSRVVRNA